MSGHQHEINTGADYDDYLFGGALSESDVVNRHDYIHKVGRIVTLQLLATSVVLHAILWFEFLVQDYSDSWLLIFSLILNAVFTMIGLWYSRCSQAATIGYLALFTLTWSYLINLLYWFLDYFDPMRGYYIAAIFFALVTAFTAQYKIDISLTKSKLMLSVGFVAGFAIVHVVMPYVSVIRAIGASVSALCLTAYLLYGIAKSMPYLSSGVEPTVSFVVTVTMLFPFVSLSNIAQIDFGNNSK
ncbi:hypothetical protein IWW57_000920 [Coemansia sp. S610]|uniref:Uncharacterized protein n=2 Tax=Coemansia TaxID=4863 RepID=A0A9W8GI93_9FUNG|nr:hypothetical protein LPJ60_004175 [Coemansia sp. RSA 2675]KAJ2023106.1 hypothetical protein GGI06_001546 [Coemansia sp. S85]KAJ2030981.1 hypothetical protein IWW57_000920 [Coemansia sp. S610]KAJ2689710.1 hypothetical protein IWW39_001302 [Coemansia spiralis]KAJ2790565.1 hypothetical protein GGI18_001719 [Coemansia linderi]